MSKEVSFEIDDAREVMYNSLYEDNRLPDELLDGKLREAYIEALEQMYDEQEQLAQKVAQELSRQVE